MRRSFLAMAVTASLVSAPSGLFDPIWSLLSSFWETKIGCEWDPNGRCLPQAKIGCELDPDGRCLPNAKAGCEWDPSGRCLPEAKAGCEMDPDGRCKLGS